MTAPLSDLHKAKRGTAILAACIVETLNDSDPTFRDRFLKRLSQAASTVRDDMEGDVTQELELINWTRENLTGFNL